jgi:hypothetical protein
MGSIPGRGEILFPAPRCPDRLWSPPSVGIGGYFLEGRADGA